MQNNRARARHRRRTGWAAAFVVIALLLTGLSLGVGTPPAHAARNCTSTAATVVQPGYPNASVTLVNCSEVVDSVIITTLQGTDAVYEGRIQSGDVIIANPYSLGWIDAATGPGVLRGLWHLNSAGVFAGITEPTDANKFKSIIKLHQGFDSTNSPYGYKGTHVEIWRTPEGETQPAALFVANNANCGGGHVSCYWTYRNGQAATRGTIDTSQGVQASVPFDTVLVNSATNVSTFPNLNGTTTGDLHWGLVYTVTKSLIHVQATLSSSGNINFTGDAGTLLLIGNPACQQARNLPPTGKFPACDNASVSSRSLRIADGPTVNQPNGFAPSNGNIALSGQQDDFFAQQSFGSTEDRYGVDSGQGTTDPNPPGPLTLRNAPGSTGHAAMFSPGYAVNPQAQSFIDAFSYHFNSTPSALGGLSGYSSLDTIVQPRRNAGSPDCSYIINQTLPKCSLTIGPNYGAIVVADDIVLA
jgi:hypothetical protein